MNEAQLKVIADLSVKNNRFIDELKNLAVEIEIKYDEYSKFEEDFMNLIYEMSAASSNMPFKPYCYAYAYNNGRFVKAVTPCISDSLYGTLSPEYIFLSDEYMEKFDIDVNVVMKTIKGTINCCIDKIETLLDKIIASNSITKRLSGLEDKAKEIENFKKMLWYPVALSQADHQIKGQFVPPLSLSMSQVHITYPFHTEQLIRYEYLFKTKNMHVNMLKNIEGILMYINEFIPFAELIPLQDNSSGINNIFSPSQVQLGSDNKFEGVIKIGNGGELEDGN